MLLLPQSPQDMIVHAGATKNHSTANERNIKHLQSDMDCGSQSWESLPPWTSTAENQTGFLLNCPRYEIIGDLRED